MPANSPANIRSNKLKSKITGEAKLAPGYCSKNPCFYPGVGGGGGALEGSFGAGVPLSP